MGTLLKRFARISCWVLENVRQIVSFKHVIDLFNYSHFYYMGRSFQKVRPGFLWKMGGFGSGEWSFRSLYVYQSTLIKV